MAKLMMPSNSPAITIPVPIAPRLPSPAERGTRAVALGTITALEDASLSTWIAPSDGSGFQYYDKGSLAGLLLER